VAAFYSGAAWQQRKVRDKLRGAEASQNQLLQVNRDYAKALTYWQMKVDNAEAKTARRSP
jgi:hypothetical protein